MTETRSPEQIEAAADKQSVVVLKAALRSAIEILGDALAEVEKYREAPLRNAIEERRRREIGEQLKARAEWKGGC